MEETSRHQGWHRNGFVSFDVHLLNGFLFLLQPAILLMMAGLHGLSGHPVRWPAGMGFSRGAVLVIASTTAAKAPPYRHVLATFKSAIRDVSIFLVWEWVNWPLQPSSIYHEHMNDVMISPKGLLHVSPLSYGIIQYHLSMKSGGTVDGKLNLESGRLKF